MALVFSLLLLSLFFSFLFLPKVKENFDSSLPSQKNYRGKELKTSGGAAIFLAWFLLYILSSLIFIWWKGHLIIQLLLFAFILMSSFVFGFLDDISPEGGKGFKGHLKLLFQGRISSGIFKILGIGLSSLFFYIYFSSNLYDLLLSAILISLCANFFNLLDLRPGRCIKFFLLFNFLFLLLGLKYLNLEWWICEVLLLPPSVFVLWYDLREELLLGDSGSNMLGVWMGVSIAVYTSFWAKLILAVLFLILNLSSEFTSFTYWIERVFPLRWFDKLGRLKEE